MASSSADFSRTARRSSCTSTRAICSRITFRSSTRVTLEFDFFFSSPKCRFSNSIHLVAAPPDILYIRRLARVQGSESGVAGADADCRDQSHTGGKSKAHQESLPAPGQQHRSRRERERSAPSRSTKSGGSQNGNANK